jgi:hypothetical protein
MTQEKDINYWKNNCEEDYITTPISVLRYISELEKLVAYPQQETMYKEYTYKINGNTYITNEEEIKKGDWYLEKAGRQYPILWNGKEKLNFHCKKIILTTDTDLINDGVAILPQQDTEKEMFELEQQLDIPNYLKWYNRKPNEPRKTTSEKYKEYQDWLNEPPEISDEEIEKAAEKNYSYDELRDGEFMGIIISSKIDAWVDAIKWYREQLKNKL